MAEKEVTTSAILAFIIGVAVGANWPEIKKFLNPYLKKVTHKGIKGYAGLMKFIAEQKEYLEDELAAAKIKKAKKSREVKTA